MVYERKPEPWPCLHQVLEEWGELLICYFFSYNYCNAQFNFFKQIYVQYSKLCGNWQCHYLEDLKKLGTIQVRLMDSEDKEEEGSEGHSNGEGVRKALELSMQNLQWKLNMFFLCCVLVVGFGTMYYVVLK